MRIPNFNNPWIWFGLAVALTCVTIVTGSAVVAFLALSALVVNLTRIDWRGVE